MEISLATVVVDDSSPPGAWKRELERHSWGYGQVKKLDVEEALWNIRKSGLWAEANALALEITGLRAEIDRMTK